MFFKKNNDSEITSINMKNTDENIELITDSLNNKIK